MDHVSNAERQIERVQKRFDAVAPVDVALAIAEVSALLAIHEVLERIDDALRNTIGGRS